MVQAGEQDRSNSARVRRTRYRRHRPGQIRGNGKIGPEAKHQPCKPALVAHGSINQDAANLGTGQLHVIRPFDPRFRVRRRNFDGLGQDDG